MTRLRSRSLSELTRQITPPTKNGHAPPPIESWKSSQSVNPYHVRTWWVFPCWVKLSRRLHSWWCPSVNSFKFQPCDHTPPEPKTLISRKGPGGNANAPPIPSRHRLWLKLRRYLIVFDPLTFVLDQWKHPWQMLSHQLVFNKSKNFTSDCQIPMPPTVPIHHYSHPKPTKQDANPIPLFHAAVFKILAMNTLISSK